MRKPLVEDLDNMENLLCRIAFGEIIPYKEIAYLLAKAMYDVLRNMIKREEEHERESRS